jgi:hypothetical protein
MLTKSAAGMVSASASCELREVRFQEPDIVEARGSGEAGADCDMGGVVVDRRYLPPGVRCGGQKGADATAAAQLEIAGRFVRSRQIAFDIAEQAGQGHAGRRLLDVEALDVGDVGNVAAGPRLGHARPSTISPSKRASFASLRRGVAREVGSQVFQPSSGPALAAPGSPGRDIASGGSSRQVPTT